MISAFHKRRTGKPFQAVVFCVLFSFMGTLIVPAGYAQTIVPQQFGTILNLPSPGTMVAVSPAYQPAILRGIKVHPENPLEFDFIVDSGHSDLKADDLKEESRRLVKYFLAGLTIPEEDLWVNLSPYEETRVIPEGLGVTEMGRDLLAQDYILKQLTASMIYPEDDLGQKFWERVRKLAYERYGTTDIPMNTFNKVWIVPSKAVVYEKNDTAFVVESRLKVMMEEDYVALNANSSSVVSIPSSGEERNTDDGIRNTSSEILKELIIPEIEKEINEGKNFAPLRQVYHSLILAAWFKQALKESLLARVYVDKGKIQGVDIEDKDIKDKIYQQYLQAYKKGVYNYIREDYDPATQQLIPRKYFSGGTVMAIGPVLQTASSPMDLAMVTSPGQMEKAIEGPFTNINVMLDRTTPPAADGDRALIGEQIGDYEVVAELGRGAFSEVYKAQKTGAPDEVVAIKKYIWMRATTEESPERREREFYRQVAGSSDPVDRRYLPYAIASGENYVVIPYYEGATLKQYLKDHQELSFNDKLEIALAVGIEVSLTLQRLHSQRYRFVHLDIKPDNIMIREVNGKYEVHIIDFNSIRDIGSSSSDRMVGTLQYVSPEQINGGPFVEQTDIYAIGLILYHILSGEVAFEDAVTDRGIGDTLYAMRRSLRMSEGSHISHLEDSSELIPPVLKKILRKMLKYDPKERYQTAGEVAGDLSWYASQPRRMSDRSGTSGRDKEDLAMTASDDLDGRWEDYLVTEGLFEFKNLHALFTPELKQALLDDPALRPVFLQVLDVGDGQLGPLEFTNHELLDTIGGEALLQENSAFSPGFPEIADRAVQEGRKVIVGVTDVSSHETLADYQVASRRQIYIPLPDGTWLGIKGVGDLENREGLTHFWATPPGQWPQWYGLVAEYEGQRAAQVWEDLKDSSVQVVQFLGYRRLFAIPDGQGNLTDTNTLLEHNRSHTNPVLVFYHVSHPHRLIKLPQLLRHDPQLQGLRQRIGPALMELGYVEGVPAEGVSLDGLMINLFRMMGRNEAVKQNRGRYSITHHLQDINFGLQEADLEEMMSLEEFIEALKKVSPTRDFEIELLSKYKFNIHGIASKFWILLKLIEHIRKIEKDFRLSYAGLEIVREFFDSYFQSLDIEFLRIWMEDIPIETGSTSFFSIWRTLLAGIDQRLGIELEGPDTIADVILQWAQEEYQRRQASQADDLRENDEAMVGEPSWDNPLVQELERDLRQNGLSNFKRLSRAELRKIFPETEGLVVLQHTNGLQVIQKGALSPDADEPNPGRLGTELDLQAVKDLAQFKRPANVPTFFADHDQDHYYELNLKPFGYVNFYEFYSKDEVEDLPERIVRKISQLIFDNLWFEGDMLFLHRHLTVFNVMVKAGGEQGVEDIKFIDWKFLRHLPKAGYSQEELLGDQVVSGSFEAIAARDMRSFLKSKPVVETDLVSGLTEMGSWIRSRLVRSNQQDAPIIVVFNGSPATAKSTIIDLLIEVLEENGLMLVSKQSASAGDESQQILLYDEADEETFPNRQAMQDLWETLLQKQRGFVIVESVNMDVPRAWRDNENLLLVHLKSSDEVRVSRLIDRGDHADRVEQRSRFDSGDYTGFGNVIVILNDEDVSSFSKVVKENLSAGMKSAETVVSPGDAVMADEEMDTTLRAAQILRHYYDGQLDLLEEGLSGAQSSAVTMRETLDRVAEDTMRSVIEGTAPGFLTQAFRLYNDKGRSVKVYKSEGVLGIVIKVPRVFDGEYYKDLQRRLVEAQEEENEEEVEDIQRQINKLITESAVYKGYEIVKNFLGGLAAEIMITNARINIEGQIQSYPFILVQEEVDIYQDLMDKIDAGIAELRRNGQEEKVRELVEAKRKLEEEFNKIEQELMRRGVFDSDRSNLRHNYGITKDQDQRMVVIDVDGLLVNGNAMSYLEGEITYQHELRDREDPSFNEYELRKWVELKEKFVRLRTMGVDSDLKLRVRTPAPFVKDVRVEQLRYLEALLREGPGAENTISDDRSGDEAMVGEEDEELTDLILAAAIMHHGGPLSIIDEGTDLKRNINILVEEIGSESEVAEKLLNRWKEIGTLLGQFIVINRIVYTFNSMVGIQRGLETHPRAIEETSKDREAIQRIYGEGDLKSWGKLTKEKYLKWLDDTERALAETENLSGNVRFFARNRSKKAEDARKYIYRFVSHYRTIVRVLRGFLSDEMPSDLLDDVTDINDLIAWLTEQEWRSKGENYPVRVVDGGYDIALRTHSGMLKLAIERIISNAFHAIEEREEQLASEERIVTITENLVESQDGQALAQIVLRNPGVIDPAFFEVDEASGRLKLLTLDFAREQYSRGVGLKLGVRMVEKLGGTVKVRNVDGQVEFIVELPLSEDTKSNITIVPSTGTLPKGKRTIPTKNATRQLRTVNDMAMIADEGEVPVSRFLQEQGRRDLKTVDSLGGIGLQATDSALEIEREGDGIAIPIELKDFENVNFNGFVPVIINLTPIPPQNLLPMLGIRPEEIREMELSRAQGT